LVVSFAITISNFLATFVAVSYFYALLHLTPRIEDKGFFHAAFVRWPLLYALSASLILTFWSWLVVFAVIVLRAVRRLRIVFDWFNQKSDIERKPLQSIGLVTGALVAAGYWVAEMTRYFV
jgi:hypothetical protein